MSTLNRISKSLKRRFQTRWYGLGNGVECCYCGWKGSQFLPSGRARTPNRLCPRCGSLERYRMLYQYLRLRTGFFEQNLRVLDVAPKVCFTQLCNNLSNITYVSTDLNSPSAMVHTDLTDSCFVDNEFDVIVCLHVLEHIREDRKAMREMYRILRPGGFAILGVPLRGEHTFEDPTASPADYERLFGQVDHVRYYGMDIQDRLREAGFDVTAEHLLQDFDPVLIERNALQGDDKILFVCRKLDTGDLST